MPEYLDNEHIHIYERAAGRPYQRPSLPTIRHIRVRDMLVMLSVFLILLVLCPWLLAAVAKIGG